MTAGETGRSEGTESPAAAGPSAEDGKPSASRPLTFHDPTAGMGGVAPTRTARVWLAVVGLALCLAATLASFQLGMTWAGVLLSVLAASTVANIAWVVYHRRG
jgi:hypothetical protein